MHATLKQIARRCGISEATASRALSNSPLVNRETRRKVLQTARECGRQSGSRLIAVIVQNYSTYFAAALSAVVYELENASFVPVILDATGLPMLEYAAFQGAVSIMAGNGFEDVWGRKQLIPLVCFNTPSLPRKNVYSVGSDDAQGIRLAVHHLTSLGHKRIGRLFWDNQLDSSQNWNSSIRNRIFQDEMRLRNLPDDITGFYNHENLYSCLNQLLKQGITALFLTSEGMGLRELQMLNAMGVDIPRDLSVIAITQPGLGAMTTPPLTALEQDFYSLARRTRILLEDIFHGSIPPDNQLIDFRFFNRGSTRSIL